MNKLYMKEAYGLLYEIENTLRIIIEDTMRSEYGMDWLIKAPSAMKYPPYRKHFSSFYYHELISFLKGYPCLVQVIPATTIIQLQNTIAIRNKIAHCKLLSSQEFDILKESFNMVIKSGYEIKIQKKLRKGMQKVKFVNDRREKVVIHRQGKK